MITKKIEALGRRFGHLKKQHTFGPRGLDGIHAFKKRLLKLCLVRNQIMKRGV
jgi:hypothetical protein